MFSKIAAVAAIVSGVAAHGIVDGLIVDGKTIAGYKLADYYAKQNTGKVPDSIGWYHENLDNGYVGGDRSKYDDVSLACSKNAAPAALSATVAAGEKVTFQWTQWPDSHKGPMITYAAPVDDFATATAASLKFTKIEEAGYDGTTWASDKMIKAGNKWEMTVPAALAPGKYVFRHETIALHGASSPNRAQNYPFCLNVEVTGSGTSALSGGVTGGELYTTESLVFNIYSGSIDYKVPGPALWSGAGGSETTPTTPTPSSGAGNSTTPISTGTPTEPTAEPTAPVLPINGNAPTTPGSGNGTSSTYTLASLQTFLESKTEPNQEYTLQEIIAILSSASAKVRRHARLHARQLM